MKSTSAGLGEELKRGRGRPHYVQIDDVDTTAEYPKAIGVDYKGNMFHIDLRYLPPGIAYLPSKGEYWWIENRTGHWTLVFRLHDVAGLAPGDALGEAGVSYTHVQDTPSDIWTINHNLGRRPSVTVVDSADTVVYGNVQYISDDTIEVTFSAGFAGKAYLN